VSIFAAPTLSHYLVLGAILFAISMAGIFLNRKNVIILLMAIRADASGRQPQLHLVFVLPERRRRAGVRILHPDRLPPPNRRSGSPSSVLLFRNVGSIDVDDLDRLKG
jgi:NADH-quinone oxidoreductase subunit K